MNIDEIKIKVKTNVFYLGHDFLAVDLKPVKRTVKTLLIYTYVLTPGSNIHTLI